MSKPNLRGDLMDEKIVLRCTKADKAMLRLRAQEKGIDTSTMLRMLLIREHLMEPVSVTPEL